MKNPILNGKKVYLRDLVYDDLFGDYFQWLNDEEVTRYTYIGREPNSIEKMKAYYQAVALSDNNALFAIIDRGTDKHIGNVRLGPIHPVHRNANFGILIGNKNFWGKGYASESMRLVVEYAFAQLNVHKINLGVVAHNSVASSLYERVGFRLEGCARGNFRYDDKFLDCLYMGYLRDDYLKTKKTSSSGIA
ncbi:MAG TPA: GNAT family protein [Candidatus Omnitrophota bacterium]|nr:GNAT family protein [Candidatus Omnitrophota bacterium]